jgi:putative restriction endonuclease
MKYWWVNQNQTFRQETSGGYLWSPKRNRNGAKNQFYENMRAVTPGDLVFSFRDAKIAALGIAISNCYDAPKPDEFGTRGENWDDVGWKVDVVYKDMASAIRPKDRIDRIRPLLPEKYSPLQQSGDGLQSVYLAEINVELATLLRDWLNGAGNDLTLTAVTPDDNCRTSMLDKVEERIETQIRGSSEIGSTEKEQLVKARRGQGRFRDNVCQLEQRCRVSGVGDSRFLIASHIKPWRSATNQERLDGENGLLLSPNIDRLFDRGFISFSDDGALLLSDAIDRDTLNRLGTPTSGTFNSGPFTEKQRHYLTFHRREIFLKVGSDG